MLGTGSVIILYLLANLAYLSVLPVCGDPDLFRQVQKLDREIDALENADQEQEAGKLQKDKGDLLKSKSTFDRGVAYVEDERVATAVLQKVSPNFGVYFMAAAIMISTFGCVNGMILMGARLYYAMARDQLFFKSAGLLNSRGVPAFGLIIQGLWAMLLVFSGSYDELLDFVMFTVLIFYVLTVVGLFILRLAAAAGRAAVQGVRLSRGAGPLCVGLCRHLDRAADRQAGKYLARPDSHAGRHSRVFLLEVAAEDLVG